MKTYKELSKEELLELKASLEADYEKAKSGGLKLDMSRGKPSSDQLDLANGLLDVLDSSSSMISEEGIDVRNYGGLEGILEARRLMGEMIGVKPENMMVSNNSSLTIMHDIIARSITHGVLGSKPWSKVGNVKFLCPVPGFDRHFTIMEFFGIGMINIPMTPQGPDMDMVERLVAEDDSIKGIWCTPKYSNPQGYVYSDETVKRFAALKPAAGDFRIFWDNAYVVHYLYPDKQVEILDILDECEKAGNPDMVYEFCSTSKVSYAGAGISGLASSKANLDAIKKFIFVQTIGSDKLNQLRHARYFKDMAGILAHMDKHAKLLRPKFEVTLNILEQELGGLDIGSWTKPDGGYFVSFNALNGCAKAIVAKCKEAGMVLTGAGATFPYGKDPEDKNIRIAPTFPTQEELQQAMELFVLCVKLVSVNKLLEKCKGVFHARKVKSA